MRIAIISGRDRLQYASYVGHQLYARAHGMDYFLEVAPFAGHRGYFHKIGAIAAHLPHYDWVVWIDDDAFITDLESPFIAQAIAEAQERDCFLVIASSVPKELLATSWGAYNSGVFALKNCPESLELLQTIPDLDLAEIERWWDHERLGIFTHGDQDAIAYFIDAHGLSERIHWVDPLRWNSRSWYYQDSLTDCPIVHFAGVTDKTMEIARFARRMGTDATLVAGTQPTGEWYPRPTAQVAQISRGELALRTGIHTASPWVRRVGRKIAFVATERRWR